MRRTISVGLEEIDLTPAINLSRMSGVLGLGGGLGTGAETKTGRGWRGRLTLVYLGRENRGFGGNGIRVDMANKQDRCVPRTE